MHKKNLISVVTELKNKCDVSNAFMKLLLKSGVLWSMRFPSKQCRSLKKAGLIWWISYNMMPCLPHSSWNTCVNRIERVNFISNLPY
jgi:hypothetical protein